MSAANVVQFLRQCAADKELLELCDSLSLADLLFFVKAPASRFRARDLASVAGSFEAYIIIQKRKESIDESSTLWPQMWGKRHLRYVVQDLMGSLTAAEIENLVAPMIHQLIFARPKPGMSEAEFQDYWVHVHAVKYASKIPQIRRYLVNTRIPLSEDSGDPLFSGMAEIWLANEQEQLASLETKEFLEGARADEPNWAAFWATLGLDTTTHTLLEGPPLTQDQKWVKYVVLLKRREGIPLETFRRYSLQIHGPQVLALPGLRRFQLCQVRDSFYTVGESRFDAVEMSWFDSVAALESALQSKSFQDLKADLANFVETKYLFALAMQEHWIIGPEAR